jgi:HD-GYP domain-containing protein (c-di-GMP phosphodiesterase class II)
MDRSPASDRGNGEKVAPVQGRAVDGDRIDLTFAIRTVDIPGRRESAGLEIDPDDAGFPIEGTPLALHPKEPVPVGGDEFCALLEADPDPLDARFAAIAEALSETGEEFSIRASYGVALLPHETHNPDQALQLADERMYASKRGLTTGVREQARDVLMRSIDVREPTLGDHSSDVAALAGRVGRRHGMDAEEIDVTVRAAELHDLGKVGVPDAILEKPAALDPDEWEFMRQHTILGERILNAAPALRPVARIVRATHERWDGTGYPDGLAGESIPLSARIVAVCDAYEAMVTDRAYRRALGHDAACGELRRESGRQFDPLVVEAFLAELETVGAEPVERPETPEARVLEDVTAHLRELLSLRDRVR